MLTSKWSSDSSFPEPDDREFSSFDESLIEISNDRKERGCKTRDDSSEDSDSSEDVDSTTPLLSSYAGNLRYDDCSTGDVGYEADAEDPDDWDDWGIALEPQDDTITKLMNTIDSNKVALPEKAEVQDFKVAVDNKEVTLTEGYQFVNRVDTDKVTKDWGSDKEKGKGIERVKKSKEVRVKAAEKFEEWTDEEQMKWENIPF